MPKMIKPLSQLQIEKARAKNKPYKLYDGDGLHLLVTVLGTKLWHLDYTLHGVRNTISLGSYPEITLSEARQRRLDARRSVAMGESPIHKKSIVSATFEDVALEWLEKFMRNASERYQKDVKQKLVANVFPFLKMDISTVTVRDMLDVLQRVDARGARETAHRLRSLCSKVFRYAIITGRCELNPADLLIGAIPPDVPDKHHAAILEQDKLGDFMRAARGYQGQYTTRIAMLLLPLLFVRTQELRLMEWSEIDFDRAVWNIPALKMKMKVAHAVPLCTQAKGLLSLLLEQLGKPSRYVFPSIRTTARPMSENTLLSAYRRMGYTKEELTGHGFRATARTMLDELLGVRVEVIEMQLAHSVKDTNGRAYNRTTFWNDRVEMMQLWGDFVEGLEKK